MAIGKLKMNRKLKISDRKLKHLRKDVEVAQHIFKILNIQCEFITPSMERIVNLLVRGFK